MTKAPVQISSFRRSIGLFTRQYSYSKAKLASHLAQTFALDAHRIADEMDATLSQSYLSQIESGARPHLTNTTRLLLAKFFKVHPGYLVDDPEGYHAELLSDVRGLEDKLDLWLIGGAERFRRDPELRRALLAVAEHADSRACFLLLASVLETPSLAERLMELLRPAPPKASRPSASTPVLVNGRQAPAAKGARHKSVIARKGELQ